MIYPTENWCIPLILRLNEKALEIGEWYVNG
jgi:hypothetical protein